ncbi:MAG: histidine--tRNA ligase [Candidatus Geothermarchaeales archaeon]
MIERPKGTRDFGPEEMSRRRHLEASFSSIARRFGYREVATPTFEHAELFIAKSGPAIVEEMYVFKDKGGRELALRPELTAPVIRFYLNELQSRAKPLKVYYLGSCYRYDEPQFGRFREFYQFGVEILGGTPLESDAEVIATAVGAVKEAGLKGFQVRVGHIGLIRDLLQMDPSKKAAIINRLDKRDVEGLKQELKAEGIGDMADILLELVGLKGGEEVLDRVSKVLRDHAREIETEALEYLMLLGDRLRLYGIEDVVYDLGVVRGLDYYTGMVFEIHYDLLGAASQICGGGAYSLTDVFGGEPLPTTGFGMGFDRVLLALEKSGVQLPAAVLDVFVIPIGDHMRDPAYQVLRLIRQTGASADVDLVGRGPSKNLEFAHSLRSRYAVLVGEREWKEGKVALKDMESGDQRDLLLDELASFFEDNGTV